MKTKAKLILAMSVLTSGVVAAGATGTFAWFTTNRAAQLNYTSVTAQKNAGNLDLSMGLGTSASEFDAAEKAESIDGAVAYVSKSAASTHSISDVSSGDGITFVKPIWATVAGNGKIASSFDSGKWGVDYTTFWFKVTNTGTNPLNVYLNSATAIKGLADENTEQKDKNDAAAKVARVAINATTKASGENDVPVMPSNETKTKTWILENHSTNDQKYVPSGLSAGAAVATQGLPTTNTQAFILPDGLQGISSTVHPDKQMLVENLAKGAPAYFVVSVWLEGTKDDGTNFDKAAGGKIDITLDLAGTEVFKA